MIAATAPFAWSEDLNETLNFWFWLRRTGEIDDADLRLRIREWAGLQPYAGHVAVAAHPRYGEYLPVGQEWKRQQVVRAMNDLRAERPRAARARHKAIRATGVRVRIQWVMAPFGERWLLGPDLAVLGVEGCTVEQRRAAVVEAALALR